MTRRPSPTQIRRRAVVAWRMRVDRRIPDRAPELRQPEAEETPLSAEEVAWGVSRGLITTARVRAFAQEA